MVTLMIGACSVRGVTRAVSARDDIGGSAASSVRAIEIAGRALSWYRRVVSALIDDDDIAGDTGVASPAMRSGAASGVVCRGDRVAIGDGVAGSGASVFGDGLAGGSFSRVDRGRSTLAATSAGMAGRCGDAGGGIDESRTGAADRRTTATESSSRPGGALSPRTARSGCIASNGDGSSATARLA
jgi:hypothetical protein